MILQLPRSTLFPYTTLFRSRRKTNKRKSKHSAMLRNKETRHRMFIGLLNTTRKHSVPRFFVPERSEERFSRNAETDLVCRLLLEKKKKQDTVHGQRTGEDRAQDRDER